MRKISAAAALVVSACTATYPVVGSFDDYNEVFRGEVNNDMSNGTAYIEVKGRRTGMRCTGDSRVVHIPTSNYVAGTFLIPYCKGQRGAFDLQCSDGRSVTGTWTADSCTTGAGTGHDSEGNLFSFTFGMDEDEAMALIRQHMTEVASKPDLPGYRPKETREEIGFSTGTGFFVSSQGHLVTNFHVIEDADTVSVLVDGREHSATVLDVDPANDVAVLDTDIVRPPLPVGPARVRRADRVLTLGYPLISLQGLEQKASFGQVNSLSGIGDDSRFLQIDVPIQPGNSGGPLINADGEVVGVVTATLDQLVTLQESGTLPQNVNYALKSDYLVPLLRHALPPGAGLESSQHAGDELPQIVEAYEASVVLVIAR